MKKREKRPMGPRQPRLPLENPRLVRLKTKERAKVVAILAQLLREASGLATKEEEVIITNGAQAAISLCAYFGYG